MFITSCRARSGSKDYEAWLRYTLGFLVDAFKTLPVRPEPLEERLASLQGKRKPDLAQTTKVDIWNAWKMLYGWADARLGVPNAMAPIPKPIVREKRKSALSEAQVDRLLWLARKQGQRDYALVRALLDTGARIGELLGLTWSDVVWQTLDDGEVVYTLQLSEEGKRGARDMPILPETFRVLQKLASTNAGGALWQGRRGPLTKWGLQGIVRKLLLKVDVVGGPHTLRHTFAQIVYDRGEDSLVVQQLMGHKNRKTTEGYLNISRGLRRKHARFSPLAGKAEQ